MRGLARHGWPPAIERSLEILVRSDRDWQPSFPLQLRAPAGKKKRKKENTKRAKKMLKQNEDTHIRDPKKKEDTVAMASCERISSNE